MDFILTNEQFIFQYCLTVLTKKCGLLIWTIFLVFLTNTNCNNSNIDTHDAKIHNVLSVHQILFYCKHQHCCVGHDSFFFFFIINFISQHVPLQKAILHARDCLYVICVICFYIYTEDCLLRTQISSYYMSILALSVGLFCACYKMSKFIEFTNCQSL